MQNSGFRLQERAFHARTAVRSPKTELTSAVIGDFCRSDFQSVIRDIRAKTATLCFDSLALLRQTDGPACRFDLIFLLESGISQYSRRDIRQLQTRRPLARIVMLAGSLAEGERRTGPLPPELIRYYWHQWETEALPDFTAFCNHRPSSWELPHTASEEERLNRVALCALRVASREKPASRSLIIADDPAMREMLVDWATQKGCEASSFKQFPFPQETDVDPPNEVVFDIASENIAENLSTIRFVKKQWPAARLTVLYNAPRPDEIRQLTQAGATRVVAKPFFR